MRTLIMAFALATFTTLFSCGPDDSVGTDGLNSLIRTSAEPAGTNCSAGGIRVDTGVDVDGNNTLDDGEVQHTNYVCTGAAVNSLVNVTTLAAGPDCANGGIQVDSGLDDNADNVLDATEIDVTRFVCNGAGGASGIIQEQIRIPFGSRFLSTSSATVWSFFSDGRNHLIDFNKNNYPGADSIVVAMTLGTSNPSNAQCVAELYNFTDGVAISNTQLVSNVAAVEDPTIYYYSGNIFDDLPDTDVDLTVRVRSQAEFTTVSAGWPSYIMIYRQVN